jgi:hypothetical protein
MKNYFFFNFRKCGAHGGTIFTGEKTEKLGEKPVPVPPLCPPQIPLD